MRLSDEPEMYAELDEEGNSSGAVPSRNRRQLLGAAASGFAVAASGLLVPAWLAGDATAADHPASHVQHGASKRRQRKHHRLKTRRREQSRQSPPPQGKRLKEVMFIIHNDTPDPSAVDIEVCVDEASVGTNWVPRPLFGFAYGATKELAYHSTRVGFEIHWDRGGTANFIAAHNPLIGNPTITILAGHYYNGAQIYFDDFPGRTSTVFTKDHGTYTISRLSDTENYIRFDVRFHKEFNRP